MAPIRNFRILQILMVLGFCFAAAVSAPCQSQSGQDHGALKRLILKDGSDEWIHQYSIQDGRVRYFSTERSAWEELPDSLVDWPATEKHAKQESEDSSIRRKALLDRAAQERAADESRYPTVAPGLRLPAPAGVFLLDEYKAQSELSELAQNGADLKKNLGSNILRGVLNPVSGSRQTIELSGAHARIQSHVLTPVIYFSVNPKDPSAGYNSETAKDHLRIVQCREKNGKRVVIAFDTAVTGKVKQQTQNIEARIAPVSNYWVKIIPSTPLQPGEYALVETGEKESINEFVWDFGVNPAASPNPTVPRTNLDRSSPVFIRKPEPK